MALPSVLSILTDALVELGVYAPGESVTAADGALGLLRFQNQLDTWQAQHVTLSVFEGVVIPWPANTSTQTIGTGGNVNSPMPMWITELNYVIPGTTPQVETLMGPMTRDSYANLSIKALQSGLPTLYFYQTGLSGLGTLFLWPQPSAAVTLKLYAPTGVPVPATLQSIVTGPPGYAEAFLYQLAVRLARPFGKAVTPELKQAADDAYFIMTRPNLVPGLLGVDPALVPSLAGGYNILSDQTSAPTR